MISPRSTCAFALLVALQTACTRTPPPQTVGVSDVDEVPPEPAAPTPKRTKPDVPEDVVERAALPFVGIRKDGKELGEHTFLRELASADAICVGERHDNPHDHFAQLRILRGMLERRSIGGYELGLGLEMFQNEFQPALDRFAEGSSDLEELVDQSQYEDRWGYSIHYYAPMLELGRRYGVTLMALNATREVTRAVAKSGLDELPEDVRVKVPEDVDLDDEGHRALFDELMAGHPPHGSMDHMYEAQVLWDETMAAAAADWVEAKAPARKMLIFAGIAHCHESAIPARIERRTGLRVVSVLPEITGAIPPAESAEPTIGDGGETQDGSAASATEEEGPQPSKILIAQSDRDAPASVLMTNGYDYRFVMHAR